MVDLVVCLGFLEDRELRAFLVVLVCREYRQHLVGRASSSCRTSYHLQR